MKIKSIVTAIFLIFGLVPNWAYAASEQPIVEAFTFTPNEIDLVSSNTNVVFDLVVSHPSGIENTSTIATLTNSKGHTLSVRLLRTDSPINSTLAKVTFKGTLEVPRNVIPDVYNISASEIYNNSTAGYKYSTGTIIPKKIRSLIGGESGLLIRSDGDLNLSQVTFAGPTHDSSQNQTYDLCCIAK